MKGHGLPSSRNMAYSGWHRVEDAPNHTSTNTAHLVDRTTIRAGCDDLNAAVVLMSSKDQVSFVLFVTSLNESALTRVLCNSPPVPRNSEYEMQKIELEVSSWFAAVARFGRAEPRYAKHMYYLYLKQTHTRPMVHSRHHFLCRLCSIRLLFTWSRDLDHGISATDAE